LGKADEARRAEESLPKQRLNFREPWPVRVILVDCKKLRVIMHGSQKSPRVLQRVTERFLADDMDSRLFGSKAVLSVQPGYRQDVDEIQPFVLQHSAQVVIDPGPREVLVAPGLGPAEGTIAEGHDLNLGDPLPSPQVKLRDHPAAKNAASQLHAVTPVVSRFTTETRLADQSLLPRLGPTPH
jgi:hypothetical protein